MGSISFKKRILVLALLTITLMPLLGFLIAHFALDKSVPDFFTLKAHLVFNLVFGISTGLVFGYIAKFIVNLNFMSQVKRNYGSLFAGMKLNLLDVWLISICAGIGEEILFRGALQPLMGVWITSLVFVAVHGYLNPWDWRISIYGLIMTTFIVVVGFMAEHLGLLSAIIVHTLIDVILLNQLKDYLANQRRVVPDSTEDDMILDQLDENLSDT